ncbi:hypothetical protein [Chlorobium sp.]|uniref:hypothetical protein n=1 Tax=Chlorobium sp. TaxID=1095 RepID=UPI003C459DE6
MKIGILGAAGLAGRTLARQIAAKKQEKPCFLGRNRAWLELLRKKLLPEAESLPEIAVIDLMKQGCLERAFEKIDILVIAISSAEHLPAVVRAALDTKTDCPDILPAVQRRETERPCIHTLHVRGTGTLPHHRWRLSSLRDGPLGRRAETLCPGPRSVINV